MAASAVGTRHTAIEVRSTQAPVRVTAVASVAVRDLLTVPGTATVLGASDYAAWLLVGDTVIVISTRDATRLPNAVEMAANSTDGPLGVLNHGEAVEIGVGRVAFGGLTVRVARWWDPVPVLPTVTPEQLGTAIPGFPAAVPTIEAATLRDALVVWSPAAFIAAAEPHIGRGPGLTPEGDDYMAGVIAGVRTLSRSLCHRPAIEMLDQCALPMTLIADARTTTFSAALIRHALRGEVAEPAGAFLRALTGRGDITQSHARLQSVGHSSGPALAAGIVCAAEALIQDNSDSDRSQT